MSQDLAALRADARALLDAAIAAVDPGEAVRRGMALEGDTLILREDLGGEVRVDLGGVARVLVVGAGKAAVPMAAAAEEVLGGRVAAGLVVTKAGHGGPTRVVEVREAAHPVPDVAGVRAARELAGLVDDAGPDDLVLVLLSGGGSALLPLPAEGVSLGELRELTAGLLGAGATIQEVNTVRKHVVGLGGGQLVARARPARVLTLVLSDVVGDDLAVIASGPTVPDPSTYQDAARVLRDRGLWERAHAGVRRRIKAGLHGTAPETPKPGDPAFEGCGTFLVGNNRRALDAAAAEATRRGYAAQVLTTSIEGEAREVAKVLAALARELARAGRPLEPPACLLLGGETTVTLVAEPGVGGRNQELALAAGAGVAGLPGVVLMAAGTDGTDGPTDAAGGMVDGETLARGRAAGLDLPDHLARNDAGTYLAATGDLVTTGPTGTNVMDLHLILVGAR